MKKRAVTAIESVSLILLGIASVVLVFSFINNFLDQRYKDMDKGYEDFMKEINNKDISGIDVTDKINFHLNSQLSSNGAWNLYSYGSNELSSLGIDPQQNIPFTDCLQRSFDIDKTKTYSITTEISDLKKGKLFFLSFGEQISSTYDTTSMIVFNARSPTNGIFRLCLSSNDPIDFFNDINISSVFVNELIE